MKLLTKKLIQQMPTLDESSDKSIDEQFVYVKLFNPCGAGTWYITSYSEEDNLAFGFVNLGDAEMAELGYISIEELETLRLPLGMKIERDLWFDKMPLKEVMERVKAGQHI
jgi:hypothetical protein